MKLKRISVHGVTTFHHPQTVELEGLGRLVAFVGPNGAGKTSLLEAVPASMFKRMPSRPGSLYDHCHGRDAFVETAFDDDGHEVVLRVLIDTDQRKAEQLVTRDGVPLTTGRSAEHAAVVERLFGSESLFLSSAFACQTKSGSFLFLPKVERKQLLIEMLGLQHLETLAQGARARGAAGDNRLAELRGALQTVQAKEAELADARKKLEDAEEKAALAKIALDQAEVNEAAARQAHQDATVKAEAAKGLERQHADALKRLDAARARTRQARFEHQQRKGDLERQRGLANQKIAGCRQILAQEPEVLAARERLKTLEDEDTAQRLFHIELNDAREDLQKAERAVQAAQVAEKQAMREVGEATHRASLDASCKMAPEWNSPLGVMRLSEMCPLLADARAAGDGLEDLKRTRRAATETLDRIAVEVNLARAAFNAVEKRRPRTADAIHADRKGAELLANKDLDAQRKWLEQATVELTGITQHLEAMSDLAIRTAQRDEEEAAREADKLADAYTEAAGAVRNLQRCQDELTAAEKATRNCRDSAGAANGCVAGLDGVIDRLEADVTKAGALAQELADVETQLGDWNLLAQALGKDGVQALEIDAAGPEVARICNELLEACYGPRFALSFETLREKKSKPGEFSESFDVRVLDRGRERTVEALSGGERVIVGEALGLAIAIFNARKNNVRHRTLYRDETAGALDPAAGQAYVDLLRRALDLGGFEQCLFVSHSPEVWQRADTRIRVSGGTAAVEV